MKINGSNTEEKQRQGLKIKELFLIALVQDKCKKDGAVRFEISGLLYPYLVQRLKLIGLSIKMQSTNTIYEVNNSI